MSRISSQAFKGFSYKPAIKRRKPPSVREFGELTDAIHVHASRSLAWAAAWYLVTNYGHTYPTLWRDIATAMKSLPGPEVTNLDAFRLYVDALHFVKRERSR